MKIPDKKFDLAEAGYDGYFITGPRSVTQGYLDSVMRPDPDAGTPADQALKSNVRLLSLVSEWNLDTDDEIAIGEGKGRKVLAEAGSVLPLIKGRPFEEQAALIAPIPIEVMVWFARQVLRTTIPQQTEDFSKGS